MSVKEWIKDTGAIGLISKAGRYGGTYAHRDIAFEFGTRISARFKIILIREFQRLKAEEASRQQLDWSYRRFLSKVNYRLHTDAIKDHLLPKLEATQGGPWLVYADEADLLNVAVFGQTAKAWREANPELATSGNPDSTTLPLVHRDVSHARPRRPHPTQCPRQPRKPKLRHDRGRDQQGEAL